jgi:UDPglucose 6-dehydrogenase
MREAPSCVIIRELINRGASVAAYDPVANVEAEKIFPQEPHLSFPSDLYDALDSADGLIVVTEWKEFRSPDLDRVREQLRQPIIFDGRNVFDPGTVRDHGLDYYSIGRRRFCDGEDTSHL